jgi:glycosyltransferase involved in cell wall biosynthesis
MPILSICVPTFNRGYMLDDFFGNLERAILGVENDIEIIVSNNSSLDNTDQICKKWLDKFDKTLKVRYFKQEVNIGLVKNILYLLKKSEAKYFVLIGDDDRFIPQGFRSSLGVLRSTKNPSAVIQGVWSGRLMTIHTGYRDFSEASRLFYEYGNAYGAIIDRAAALAVLDNKDLRHEIESIVWPQTVFGFLAIYGLKERPIYITNYEVGGPIADGQNITNKTYWVNSLYGLLRASYLIDGEVGFPWTKNAFVRLGTRGFRNHLSAILLFSVITPGVDSKLVRQELKCHFGLYGKLCSFVFFIADRYPGLLYWVAVIFYTVTRFQSPKKTILNIAESKNKYFASVENAKISRKRTEGWF